jgi:hypothetical protein
LLYILIENQEINFKCICSTLYLLELKVVSLCHQYKARPTCISMQFDQACSIFGSFFWRIGRTILHTQVFVSVVKDLLGISKTNANAFKHHTYTRRSLAKPYYSYMILTELWLFLNLEKNKHYSDSDELSKIENSWAHCPTEGSCCSFCILILKSFKYWMDFSIFKSNQNHYSISAG